MKLRHKLIYTIALGLFLSSCDNKLDVKPVTNIDASTAVQTSADVEAILIGAYDSMGDADVLGGNPQRDAELIGDNGDIEWQGTFVPPAQIFNKNMLRDNGQAATTWLDTYRTINVANTVLANLGVVTTAKKNRVEGEAKAIRAWMLFNLVRVYAKAYVDGDPKTNLGVPIVTTPTSAITEANFVSRNTVDQVYQQVITDLTSAESLLPATNGFFISKYTAAALLARVYLSQGNYELARQAANRVITSGAYSLVASFDLAFNNRSNSSEDIFAVQQTEQDNDNGYNTFFASPDYGGRGDIKINDKHLASYESGDERGLFFYESGDIFTAKWADQFANIPQIRLSEMYLIRAEANFRLGGAPVGATALSDINRVRARANASLYTSLTLDDILKERRFELAFEGHLIHDIKRNKQTITKNFGTEVRVYTFNSPKLVFPIPMRETDANSKLIQNEGYN
ncbi:RagB/SusD family nutrient uptake outer membrane protein [Flectobacillus roseus]|uniref:RagB/SusD family nutrient uptake outer membrane protein n=1 Tax=Flectobacillus roseus TaxID=502259 RepID=UPI0024B80C3B|nr:RagB/SusD family nutrient uptake outer membrane protein [Flectobacillus roseus]MDI9868809.1 RagB/SusD family nutrient uptake outer membrane protein [Flectobacillus roseus]